MCIEYANYCGISGFGKLLVLALPLAWPNGVGAGLDGGSIFFCKLVRLFISDVALLNAETKLEGVTVNVKPF